MKTPVHNLKKTEIIWLADHRCRHGHTYLVHYGCYLKEQPHRQRIGFFDIEASNLDAPFGFLLSYCIKDSLTKKILCDIITPQDIKKARAGDEDKRIIRHLIQDLGQFDRIVTHYGKRFDVPFIRTRALMMNIPFPQYGSLNHTDTYFIAKYKLKLGSNRLDNIETNLFGETLKTKIQPKYWRAGSRGDKRSLKYILEHNKRDVESLERIYYKLSNFIKEGNTSI